jgi:hypothetical protein
MTREFACDFVEDKRPWKENAAIKYDFLDFHAAPSLDALMKFSLFM